MQRLMILSACALLTMDGALAQTPRAFMEQSAVSGAGNTVSVYRAPVVNGAGVVSYKDVQIQFDVSTTGVLTVRAGFPKIMDSPVVATGAFIPGRYRTSTQFAQLNGPGVGAGGRTTWSLNSAAGQTCQFSASWTSGPIAGHPLQARLAKVAITNNSYAYGVMGDVSFGCYSSTNALPISFSAGDLIGVAVTGNGLTINNFTNHTGTDQSSPVTSASFQRCLSAAC